MCSPYSKISLDGDFVKNFMALNLCHIINFADMVSRVKVRVL